MCLDDIIKTGYFRRSAGIGSSHPVFVSRHRIGLAGTVRKAHIASQAGGHPRVSAKSRAEGAPNHTGSPEARNLVNFTLTQTTVWAM
jgi:hypothetical protein